MENHLFNNFKTKKCKKKCKRKSICNLESGRCNIKNAYNVLKLAKKLYKGGKLELADKYGKSWKKKWEKYKLRNSRVIDTNLPLEFTRKHVYGKLDYYQTKFICEQNALDLVLVENANELFREFMQEPEGNKNIELLLSLICKTRPGTIYLDSETFDIEQIDEYDWIIKKDYYTQNQLKKYLRKNRNIIKKEKKKNNFIATIIGLNLGEGGHYGALLYDIHQDIVIVMDSMQLGENSGLTENFNELAKLIFSEDDKLKVHNPDISYFLQPTGGFEKIMVPIIEDSGMSKRDMKKINYQHIESQNHFCYIWACWMIHLYISGYKLDEDTNKSEAIVNILNKNNMIPFILLKRYILGFIPILEKLTTIKLNERDFFYKHFNRIWSNHKNELELDFKLYSFNYEKNLQNIDDALKISLDNYVLTELKNTKINEFLCR